MKNDLHHFIAMKNGAQKFVAPDGAAIHKMNEKQLCETFAQTTALSHGAFRTLGKLRYELEEKTGKDAIYAKLAAYSIESEDISNAGPACHAYRALVIPGHVKEADFDTFTFGLCRAVTRSLGLSEKSPTKVKLEADAIADIIKKFKKNAQKNLECSALHGVLLAEYEAAQAEEAAKAKKAAKAEVKGQESGVSSESDAEDEDNAEVDPNVGTVTHGGSDTGSPDKSTDDRTQREAAPPKAKASGMARCNELLDELDEAVLDGVTPADAKKLYERVAALAQVLCEFAATGEPEPVAVVEVNPRAKSGKNGSKPALAA